jgi:hypothetical protein
MMVRRILVAGKPDLIGRIQYFEVISADSAVFAREVFWKGKTHIRTNIKRTELLPAGLQLRLVGRVLVYVSPVVSYYRG